MKYLKMLGLAAVAAMALTAFTAGSASATTLEVGGVTKNEAVTIEAEATEGAVLARTDGSQGNVCTESKVKGTTEHKTIGETTVSYTGTKVTGALSTLTFKKCELEEVVVDAAGQLYVEHESGTTSGTVYSENAVVTVPTSFGFSVTCKTNEGTKVGTLTGGSTGHSVMTVNAVLNCGFLLPSATWKGSYKVTSPTGLGVSA